MKAKQEKAGVLADEVSACARQIGEAYLGRPEDCPDFLSVLSRINMVGPDRYPFSPETSCAIGKVLSGENPPAGPYADCLPCLTLLELMVYRIMTDRSILEMEAVEQAISEAYGARRRKSPEETTP